jgi:hypothetical protein
MRLGLLVIREGMNRPGQTRARPAQRLRVQELVPSLIHQNRAQGRARTHIDAMNSTMMHTAAASSQLARWENPIKEARQ